MLTCKASNFNFGTLSPNFTSARNPNGSLEIPKTGHASRNYRCMVFSSADGPKWNGDDKHFSPNGYGIRSIFCEKERGRVEEEDDGKVHCEVEVISWRERRIKAEMLVDADIESVWNALTDYERLADFVPNLVSR